MANMWRHIFNSLSTAFHAPTLLVLRGLVGLIFLPLLACSGSIKDVKTIKPTPAHHRADGYQNNYTEYQNKGLAKVLQWKWAALRDGLPVSPKEPTSQRTPDLMFIYENAKAGMMMQPTVTWIGHSTTLVQMSGLNMLTDPIFSDRASPFKWIGPKRTQPPGLSLEQLPHIDVVLISHNHYDHCDEDSLQALSTQSGGPPTFIVPLGLKAWFASKGIDSVVELDWWQSFTLAGVDIVFTPAQHWSGRGLTDRRKTLWGGFAVFAEDFQLFFAGDTGYSKDFADISAHFANRQKDQGFDLALIPVGAYEPRWFMREEHVNPEEAVRIHKDLRSNQSIGVHWGTFMLTDEALDQPPHDLAGAVRKAGLSADAFTIMAIGETRKLTPRHTQSVAPAD